MDTQTETQTIPPSAPQIPHTHKNPWIAAGLNLLLVGAGYAYLGMWGKGLFMLGIAIFAGFALAGVGIFVPMGFALYDCFVTAQKMNRGEPVSGEDNLRILGGALKFFMGRR